MRVACVSAATGGRLGPWRAIVRAVLLSLLLPALTALAHPSARGLHDLATSSVMLKAVPQAALSSPAAGGSASSSAAASGRGAAGAPGRRLRAAPASPPSWSEDAHNNRPALGFDASLLSRPKIGVRTHSSSQVEAHGPRVLRLGPSDKIVLFDGRRRRSLRRLLPATAQRFNFANCTRRAPHLRLPYHPRPGDSQKKNMDLIVQKAVEIGAAESPRFFPIGRWSRLDEESGAVKQSKWQAVAIEAAKQCGQNWLPLHRGNTAAAAGAVLSGTSRVRFAIDRLAPVGRSPCSERDPRAILGRTWEPPTDVLMLVRPEATSRRRLRSPGARVPAHNAGPDRSQSNRVDLLPGISLLPVRV